MRKFHLVTIIFFLCSGCLAQRTSITLDTSWRFHLGHAADPAKDFNYGISTIFSKSGAAPNTAIDPNFNDRSWRKLDLPHDWAVELPFVESPNFDVMSHGYKPVGGLFPETSIGWYRKHFSVARKDSGDRFSIYFEGIFRNANVWINGFYLGNHQSGYTGVTYDITDYLRFDKENVLVVRVDATQYEGWFYEGAGIYRHVWLNQTKNVHVAENGLFIYSKSSGKADIVTLETSLEASTITADNYSLQVFVSDRAGKKIAEAKPVAIRFNGHETIAKHAFTISNSRKWSLEDPYLYRMNVVIRSGNKIVDSITQRFGIRNIEVKNTGVFLNGRLVKIKGVNCHQDHAGIGSALPDYLQYYRVRLLKDMGANAYRTSHHPPSPALLDACDSLGMLVMDEQRLLNSSPVYMDQFEFMVKRDRSRASVFIWSIGNEEGWIHTTGNGKQIALTLLAKLKELDPTRTATYAADVGNVYQGVNEVIPVRSFNYRQNAVADYHRDHPTQPILGTEMGSTVTTRGEYVLDSIKGYVPDQDITAPWWASKAEEWWPLAADNSYWLGGFVWTGFDYRGEPTPFKWPNINSHFGIMDMCGFPKNIYYYYQSWWTDKDVLHISPHWNTSIAQNGKPVEVWVNSNANNVELFLNGKSLGKKDMPRNSHLTWMVNYEPGILKAVAYKKGKRFETTVETSGAPAEVVITPGKTTITADGKDVSVINVKVIDKQGREVADASNLISFELEGDAKIIGVGNGDPSSHEPDKILSGTWQRHLFNGKCQVIIQSGYHPGLIKFAAKSEGLWQGSTDIISVPASAISQATGTIANSNRKEIDKMLGADISFLPELEAKGMKFYDNGIEKDAISILKDHGFNYVRLRIFNEPARDSGYSPGKGFCDLAHTLAMAKRVKAAGMKFLLDFHYSDYWADPGKQYTPFAWKNLSVEGMSNAVYDFTKKVLSALKEQGTAPDMVQVGNEINHGILWPLGNVSNLDNLAAFLKAGSRAVHETVPDARLMLHIALGGQHDESVYFIDQMIARNVPFDVIGESWYPKWHGTLDELRDNLQGLVNKYDRDIIVVEYSQFKEEVNKIAFDLPGGHGKGSCIWEPLNTWEAVFDKQGQSNEFLKLYDELARKYLR